MTRATLRAHSANPAALTRNSMTSQPSTTERADYARDHLANDRTYLAWLRTALNVIVLGLIVAKFVEDGSSRAETAGLMLVGVGLFLLFYGSFRAQRTSSEIRSGRYALHPRGVLMVTATLTLSIIATLILLFW